MSGTQRSVGLLLRGLIVVAVAAIVLIVAYFVVKNPSSPSTVIALTHRPPVTARTGDVLVLGKGRATMASGPAGLWVARVAQAGAPGRLVQIDTSTGKAEPSHPLSVTPVSLAVGRGVVWVLGTLPGSRLATLLRIDPSSGKVTARAPLAEPPACATHPFASCYPVATRDGVWVPLIDQIVHVPRSGTMTDRTVPVGGHVWDLTAGDHRLWALAEVALYKINERTFTYDRTVLTQALPAGLQANHVVVDDHSVWISSFPRGDAQLPGRIVHLLPGGKMPRVVLSRVYPGAGSLALADGGLWIDRYDGQGELDRLDAATGALTGPFVVVPDDVTAIAARGGVLWILSYRPTGNKRTVTRVSLTPVPSN
ncbi:MAG: hypothetical protein QOI17_1924 [Gaiellales bacterium]|nr:hypothetical protein [Gaiellales bacterium]